MKVKKQRIIFGYILLELLVLNASALGAAYFKSLRWPAARFEEFMSADFPQLLLIFNLSWILISLLSGSQNLYITGNLSQRFKDMIVNVFILLGISSTVILLADLENNALTILVGPVFIFAALNAMVLLVANKALGGAFAGDKKAFGLNLLVLGAGNSGKQVLSFTQKNHHLGYKVVGFLDDHYPSNNGITLLGKLEALEQVLDTRPVDEIVIALPPDQQSSIKHAIQVADYRGIRVNLVQEYPDFLDGDRFESYNLGSMPVLQLKQVPLDQFHHFMAKKLFDLLFAGMVLLMLSPILIAIAILIKLNSKGPVFYKPTRLGQANGAFKCFKFRTMYTDLSPAAGQQSTTKDDPRITKVGKVLRRYSLDELPQFINVLKGDMSVVGPRPHRLNLNTEFQEVVDKYMIRHYVKPGITGWAQVNGWRGPTETLEQKVGRSKHDLWYLENWSFWLDIRIIWLTVFGSKVHENAF
jgi:putative colanic acid biosynthesis UDP-glucose lipid carrier transferase